MAPPAQAFLTSLIARVAFGKQKDLTGASEEDDEERLLKVGGVEIIVNDGGNGPHAVYPHYSDMPDCYGLCHASYPTFETSHAVYPHYSDEPENGLLGAHVTYPAYPTFETSHVVYPHYSDKPKNGLLGAHVTYPAYPTSATSHVVYPHYSDKTENGLLGAHVTYPAFEKNSGGGLIGEKYKDGTLAKNSGIEIITSAGAYDNLSHAVYPHYNDKPEDGLLGAHVTYPVYPHNSDELEDGFPGAHVTYPTFEKNSGGGLIGERVKNDILVKNGGIEIITSAGAYDNLSHAVYPHYNDKPEDGLLGAHVTYPVYPHNSDEPEEGLLSAHTAYSAIESSDGGLIGEKFKDDMVENGGIEIITRPAAYPVYGGRPEEGLLGERMVNGKFATTSEGLMCEFEKDSMFEHHCGEIAASDNSISNGLASSKPCYAESVSKFVPDDCKMDPLVGKDVDKLATNIHAPFPSKLPAGPGLEPRCSPALKDIEDNKQMTLLIAAFFALPQETILHAMQEATTPLAVKSGSPRQICTGCGSSVHLEGVTWNEMPPLATTMA